MSKKRSSTQAFARLKKVPKKKPVPLADLPDLMDVPTFMEATDTSRTSVYNLIRRGFIPVVRIGPRHLPIPKSFLLKAG